MNRRDWLKLFSTGVVGAMVLDPEQLLWVPGEKTIFLPPVLEAEPVIASYGTHVTLWQLQLRVSDLDLAAAKMANPFSTVALEGPHFHSEWVEVGRDKSKVTYEQWSKK
jgi:hypothetical protein